MMKKTMAFLFALLLVCQASCPAFSSNEKILKRGTANLQKNIEHVTGELSLMETELIFESHGINFQGGTTRISLDDIAVAETGWSKLLGLLPMLPNALKITMKDDKVYRFTCFWPSRWRDAVNEQISKMK